MQASSIFGMLCNCEASTRRVSHHRRPPFLINGKTPGIVRDGRDTNTQMGRERNSRFGVRDGNKQTFVHGDCQRQASLDCVEEVRFCCG
jgi:hypothetical protein